MESPQFLFLVFSAENSALGSSFYNDKGINLLKGINPLEQQKKKRGLESEDRYRSHINFLSI
jgi:hypothetical protein